MRSKRPGPGFFLCFALLLGTVYAEGAALNCGLKLGDSRGIYSATACSSCQTGFQAVVPGAGGIGNAVENNLYPAYGNSFPCNPNLCAGEIAGTIIPGSAKLVVGTFCGACVCDGKGGWFSDDLGNREHNVNTCPLPYPAVNGTTFNPGNQVCIPADCTALPFNMTGTLRNPNTGGCECPAGQYWDGLPPRGCKTYDPAAHRCGNNSPGVQNWNGGVTGQVPANPKLLCCANGWDTSVPNGNRRDCLETDTAALDDFEKLYNYNCGATVLPATDPKYDNLICPNRLFLLQAVTYNNQPATPIPGFYNAKTGTRCPYFSGNNPTKMKIADQLALFDFAVANDAVPTEAAPFVSANSGTVHVAPTCGTLVRLAMQVKCPDNSPSQPPFNWTIGPPEVPVRRCTAAEKIWVHLSLRDLSRAGDVGRGRFRTTTSYVTPAKVSKIGIEFDTVKLAPISYQKIIENLAPTACPTPLSGTNPPCINN